jgi:hypothetical protein
MTAEINIRDMMPTVTQPKYKKSIARRYRLATADSHSFWTECG